METSEDLDTSHLVTKNTRIYGHYISSLAAWFGSLSVGVTLGYTATAIPSLKSPNYFMLKPDDIAWLGSLCPFGASFGALVAGKYLHLFVMTHLSMVSSLFFLHLFLHIFSIKGPYVEKFGRKMMIMMSSIPFVIGWLAITYAPNIPILLIGRFITGLCCGAITVTVPVYIAETVPAHSRGFFGSGFQLFITLGILISYAIGDYLPFTWLACVSSLFPLIMLIIFCFVPESPIWLAKKNYHSSALKSYAYLYNCEPNPSQLMFDSSSESRVNFLTDLRPALSLSSLRIVLILMFFQQFSGINVILFYATDIFHDASSSVQENVAIIIVSVIQVVGTLISCLLTDKFGRKFLLILSGIFMCLSLASMSTYFFLLSGKGSDFVSSVGWLPLVSILIFVIAFSIGFGPIPWVLMSELIPNKFKGTASGIAASFNWFCCFIITKIFMKLTLYLTTGGAYALISAICFLDVMYTWRCVPETRGKSLQELEAIFESN